MKKFNGYFGEFGGAYVSKELKDELSHIYREYKKLKNSKEFQEELRNLQRDYQGRPTPLYFCKNLTNKIGGANIYLKREDLNHTGAHKINHCIGECLLAKYLGKTKVIGETGAGQHGLALATACAILGLKCDIHMGEIDIKKQYVNVQKMRLLGAKVINVTEGSKTLKEAVESALRAYASDFKNSIYCIGSVVGPHPFPTIVRDFQAVIGREVKFQARKQIEGKIDALVACVGGGSNAIGLFNDFIKERDVMLIGVEPLGKGLKVGENGASIMLGKTAIAHGFRSKVILDENGEVAEAYSIASGLDYPAIGPQHAYLSKIGRVQYVGINDKEALDAFYTLSKVEGIIPALESSHAVAYGIKLAKKLGKGKNIVVNLSGRGDKDLDFVLSLEK